jgi:hypothetical protein
MAWRHYYLTFLQFLTTVVTLFKKAMFQAEKTDILVDNMTPLTPRLSSNQPAKNGRTFLTGLLKLVKTLI